MFLLPWMQIICLVVAIGSATAISSDSKPPAAPKPAITIESAAKDIDRLVDDGLRQRKLKALPITSDERFLRRIYLDAIGRIPTLDETREFLASADPNKRALLIDKLLDSRGYASTQYNFWADILRIKDQDSAISRAFYINWVKDSLAANKPYDQFVRELVTASGSGWQRNNGAVGYYLRDRGMPLDNMANTLRIFVGTRVGCAQCHDHPHDHWTRRQLYEMAAFTNNLSTDVKDDLFSAIYARELKTKNEDLRAFSQYIRNTYHADRVIGISDGSIKLPGDYQYDDAAPNQSITAHPLFGSAEIVNNSDKTDYRRRFGDWLTSPDNPRFTLVVANRLWKRAMGRGLIEPVDELKDDTVASHPELLAYLTQLMKDVRYDMKAYMRVLYNTQTYQRAADSDEPEDVITYSFRGHLLRRMRAEELWDSLVTVAVPDVDERQSDYYDATIRYHGRPVLVGKEDMYKRYEEVKDHNVDQHWKYLAEQLKAMQDDLKAQVENVASDTDDAGRGFYRRPNSRGLLVRASELRSPEVPSHFLRVFGQSNREFIEGGSAAANVTQFLSMFNGFVEADLLAKPDCELQKHLSAELDANTKRDVAFLSIMNRLPTAEEKENVEKLIQESEANWCSNLVWALINSQQFIFVE
jgi:hypothetical protein